MFHVNSEHGDGEGIISYLSRRHLRQGSGGQQGQRDSTNEALHGDQFADRIIILESRGPVMDQKSDWEETEHAKEWHGQSKILPRHSKASHSARRLARSLVLAMHS